MQHASVSVYAVAIDRSRSFVRQHGACGVDSDEVVQDTTDVVLSFEGFNYGRAVDGVPQPELTIVNQQKI